MTFLLAHFRGLGLSLAALLALAYRWWIKRGAAADRRKAIDAEAAERVAEGQRDVAVAQVEAAVVVVAHQADGDRAAAAVEAAAVGEHPDRAAARERVAQEDARRAAARVRGVIARRK